MKNDIIILCAWLAILYCTPYCNCFGYHERAAGDSGGRCRECGKMTMMGATHICRPSNSNTNRSKQISTYGAENDKDIITGDSLIKMRKLLPPFEGRRVLGIEICNDYEGARPCLKVEAGFGAVSYYELQESKYSYDKEKYEKAKAYYDENVLLLPLLPSIKGERRMSDKEFVTIVGPIINAIKIDRQRAQDKQKKDKQDKEEYAKKMLDAYNSLKELFGRKIFQKIGAADDCSSDRYGGEYVRFKANESSGFSDWECYYLVTPKDKRIYEISGRKCGLSPKEIDALRINFENTYGMTFNDDNGIYMIQGINKSGNTRRLELRVNGKDVQITLSDLQGINLAIKEGSLFLADRRRQEEEERSYAPIAIWPNFVKDGPQMNIKYWNEPATATKRALRAKMADNYIWLVHVETLSRAHKRISNGKPSPFIHEDGLVEINK